MLPTTLSPTPDVTFTADPNVIATSLLDGETVLLHLLTQRYYTLNETGAEIWQGLTQGHTLGAISQALVERYTLTLAEAEQAVRVLLNDLLTEKLVEVVM